MGLKQLRSGAVIDVLNPDPDSILIEDIAHSLSMLNRFGGHTPVPYSVAAHSIGCALIVDSDILRLDALMHDATEAYLGDVTRPIKSLKEFDAYVELEDNLYKIIAKKFGFREEMPDQVKKADNAMLYLEGLKFFPVKTFDWNIDHFINGFEDRRDVADVWIDLLCGRNPGDVKDLFMSAYNGLTR